VRGARHVLLIGSYAFGYIDEWSWDWISVMEFGQIWFTTDLEKNCKN
jgi:hypothetical protein